MTGIYSSVELKQKAFWHILGGFSGLAALFFLSSGTVFYWEAWLYLAVLLVPVVWIVAYLLRQAPDLLERRMRMQEKESSQKLIIGLSAVVVLVVFMLPGLDKRYGWSSVPPAVVIAADAVVLLSYAMFARVLKENRYASRIIEVEQQQLVISTGPYAVIRHPMYFAVLLLYIFSPLALGSYWAMIPVIALPILLVARIHAEEALLTRDLKGYEEYMQRVKYRLIPGVW
jgi:protein-S-isoprenylcysteine O-methyltransferase Ste14